MSAIDGLHEAMARVADGFLALDASQRFTYANPRAVKLLGRGSESELLGRHLWSEFPQVIGTSFQRAFEQAKRGAEVVHLVDFYPPSQRWFDGRFYPSANGMSIYFTDITERRQAEQALRLSEQKYRLAATLGHVWDWNVRADEYAFPAAFWRQLGIDAPPEGSVMARFESVIHPDDLLRFRDAVRGHLTRRVPYALEFRACHADGDWRWFTTQGQAVWDAGGRATYMAGTTFEITERKRAELALRESEAYRRNLFEQLADAVLLIDRDLRICDANPQALSLLGYSREELLQISVPDLLAEPERKLLPAQVAAMMEDPPQLADWNHLRKDGSRFPAEVSARALDGQRFLAVVRDVTVRRASEKALLDARFELSQLAQRLLSQEKATTQRVAQALHDHLGQTLAVARFTLDACISAHGQSMPAELRAQSGRIAGLLHQAIREVRQVLADLRPPLLDDDGLAAAIDNEIRSRTSVTGGAAVRLDTALEAGTCRWPSDVEYAAFMIAREAITNALQHAGAGLIHISLTGGEGSLRLNITDDGAGIPLPVVRGRPGHLGIVGMRERAAAIGARFTVVNEPAGGTRVTLQWEADAP